MVRHDLKVLQKLWVDAAVRDFNAYLQEQLQKIDYLERRAWEAYELSLGGEVTETDKFDPIEVDKAETDKSGRDTNANGMLARLRKETTRKVVRRPEGNVQIFGYVQWCIDARLKIFGLYAPVSMSIPELDKRMEQIINQERDDARQKYIDEVNRDTVLAELEKEAVDGEIIFPN